jgi:hypothetical protein
MANDADLMKLMNTHSYRQEREFGLIVGGVFLLLSSWWLYRGKFSTASHIILPLSIVLLASALILPRALRLPNKAWMLLAEGLSYVSTRVILAIVFFGLVTPIGVVKRLFGWDPLNRRAGKRDSYWLPYSGRQRDPRHYEKMY